MSLKALREDLCRRQITDLPPDVKQAVSNLISRIDTHRPLGPDGKHGRRHTDTCGCEDKL